MKNEENINPLKRPRVGVPADEIQRLLEEKEQEYELLNKKFDYIMKENQDLRKKIEDLHQKFVSDESDGLSSEDGMIFEELPVTEAADGKCKSNGQEEVSKTMKKNQSDAVAGSKKSIKVNNSESMNVRNNIVGSSTKTTTNKGNKKSKSVPVITTYNVELKKMVDLIDVLLGHKNYSLKTLGKNVVNFGVCTLEDYDKVKALLESQKVNFYTYTPKGLRPFTVVIEGLPHSFDSGDILEYLKGLQINVNVIGLAKLGNDKWVVRMSRDSDIGRFYDIRYILRCRVHIRKFVVKGITQCYNCQRFGHVSTNCRMPYRCVKCGGSHGPGKCNVPPKGENTGETLVTDPVTGQVSRQIGLPVSCVNCGVVGHAASSKECPRRIEILRKLEDRKVARDAPRSTTAPTSNGVLRPGVSYAAAAGAASGDKKVKSRNGSSSHGTDISLGVAMEQYNVIDRDCKRFFGGGLVQCLGRIGGFAKEYRDLGCDEDRSRALLGMLMSLGHHG